MIASFVLSSAVNCCTADRLDLKAEGKALGFDSDTIVLEAVSETYVSKT